MLLFPFLMAAAVQGGSDPNSPVAIELRAPREAVESLETATLEVEVLNVSADMRAGLLVGRDDWHERLVLRREGEPIAWLHADAPAEESYELAPGTSVLFLLPLGPIVEQWAALPEQQLAGSGRGFWTVELLLAGARSNLLGFEVTERAAPLPGAEAHPSLRFLAETERRFAQASSGEPGAPSVADVARSIEIYLLGVRRESYAGDPALLHAVGRLGWLLRRCGSAELSVRLTGSYLLARDAFGPSGREWVEAARLEHEAVDALSLGDWRRGAVLYRGATELLPGEVLYHMAAVRQLELAGAPADAERAALGVDGLARYQALQIDRTKPGSAFVLGFLTGHMGATPGPEGR